MAVPYTFGNATTSIPLSQLDTNFATAITIGNTAVYLGNTTTTFGNVTLTNATISSGNVTLTSAIVPTVIGGTTASSTLTLQSTNGVGTSDAISFKVGNNGATTAMTINTSGNVGIGTTSPAYKVDILSSSIAQRNYAAATAFSFLRAQGTESVPTAISTTSNMMRLISNGYDGSAYQSVTEIRSVTDGAISNISSPGYLMFLTTPSGSVTPTERMRINSSGNVGIGTSSPGKPLDVNGVVRSTGATAIFTVSNRSIGSGDAWGIYSPSGDFRVYDYQASLDRLTIDTSGNVGIGTSSPGYLLQVGSSTNRGRLAIVSTSSSSAQLLLDASANASGKVYSLFSGSSSVGSFDIYDSTAAAYRLTIDTNGFVGIGTSSPSYKLQVASGNANISDSTATQRLLRVSNSLGATEYQIQPDGSTRVYNDSYIIWTTGGGSESMRIDTNGNLLVGTTTQIGSEKLSVRSGATNATQYTTIATKGGSSFYIEQQQTTSVSTTATTILASPKYCTFCLVHGSDGTNRFSDVVLMSVGTGTVNVISSLSASGTPSARTYSQSSSTLKVAMGSGTYTVQVTSLNMTS